MERIVDIATDGLHLSAFRGFLLVQKEREEVGWVALDDIHAIIVHAHGVTWTTNLLVALAERGALMVLCASNHHPTVLALPIEGHHAQGARIRAQWDAPKPLLKQLWRQIVVAKIVMQRSLLAALGKAEASGFDLLARRVKSGDPENVEAQAARRYWPALMGEDFRRDRTSEDANALLNYGYTVMRSCVARAVVGSGLHPTIGLHHTNRGNAFALADDLIEPFRPLVDAAVTQLISKQLLTVNPQTKRHLAEVITFDVQLGGMTSTVSHAAIKLAQSLARSFEQKKADLLFFDPPTPIEWRTIGNDEALG